MPASDRSEDRLELLVENDLLYTPGKQLLEVEREDRLFQPESVVVTVRAAEPTDEIPDGGTPAPRVGVFLPG
jgi:hypothetical protein